MLEVAEKVFSGIRAVREIAKKMENAELRDKLAELMNDSADLKMELADMKEGQLALREENKNLKNRDDLRACLVRREGLLFPLDTLDRQRYGSGPFCPLCFDDRGQLTSVVRIGGRRSCPRCEAIVG